MKRLIAFDMDGSLINSPEPEDGKKIWKEKTGEEYPHKGWWGRKESLDTNVFEIKPFPTILKKLEEANNLDDTHVIILTSRLEKLRPEVENILNLNNIHVDELIMKNGSDDKGDIIQKYVKNNPDLEQIIVYDDFAGGMKHKIHELTKIKDKIPQKIAYKIVFVKNGEINNTLKSGNIFEFIIFDEILKNKQ